MPMQFYSSLPNTQTVPRSPFTGQSITPGNLYSRLYNFPNENLQSSSPFFGMESSRQFMPQALLQQQTQLTPWQASNISSMGHPATPRQLTEESPTDYTRSWYNDQYDQQLQAQVQAQMQAQLQAQTQAAYPRTMANYVGPSFDGNQVVPSNLMPFQQSRTNFYQPGTYQEPEQDNGQFNIPQSYQYHGQLNMLGASQFYYIVN